MHGLALFSLWWCDLPLLAQTSVSGLLAVSAAHSIVHHALRLSRGAVVGLELKADGALTVRHRDGGSIDARVHADSTLFVGLIVLLLGLPGSRRKVAVVIAGDAADDEDLRVLRAWLRWLCAPARGTAA